MTIQEHSLDATGQNVEFYCYIVIIIVIWPPLSASRVHFEGGFSIKKGIQISKID